MIKKALFFSMMLSLFSFSSCDLYAAEDDYRYYKTKAGSADITWNVSVEIPDKLDLYRIERNNTSEYWDEVLSLYDFPAHYSYKKDATYEKDGVRLAVTENDLIKITLPKKQNPYNTLSGPELTEKAKAHFESMGIQLIPNAYLWGFYEEGENKGDIYICEIDFSQCTAEGYQIYSDAARVSFRDDDVYKIELSVNEIVPTERVQCVTSRSVCNQFANIDLYTGREISDAKSVTVDSAKITYAPKEDKNELLIPYISFEGAVSDGDVTLEYESAGIPLC